MDTRQRKWTAKFNTIDSKEYLCSIKELSNGRAEYKITAREKDTLKREEEKKGSFCDFLTAVNELQQSLRATYFNLKVITPPFRFQAFKINKDQYLTVFDAYDKPYAIHDYKHNRVFKDTRQNRVFNFSKEDAVSLAVQWNGPSLTPSCIVCNENLSSAEYKDLHKDFKGHPVHGECFDNFDNAREFLKYAKGL